jgi:hypothetical protein
MARTFLPKAHYMPDRGVYRPLYKWYREDGWTLVPGRLTYPTAQRAIQAADDFLAKGLNPPIRSETVPDPAIPDFLDPEAWNRERAVRQAEEQQGAFGTVFVRHKPVRVEYAKRRV